MASEEKFSRRSFFKGLGATAVATAAQKADALAGEFNKYNTEKIQGPGAIPVELKINGKTESFQIEPRVTLLDALRNHTSQTGAKEVCDRATCGACTVLIDGTPTYACMVLAIEARGHEITTVEGLSPNGKLTKLQEAFVACDGLQCGYCTPGFVLSLSALLEKNPKPTEEDVRKACSGNLCRCGSYPRVFQAALQAAGVPAVSKCEIVRMNHV
jgi:aerobic-type carbon monoxide dehydrogenase small subunit (CoxS/CutS family)